MSGNQIKELQGQVASLVSDINIVLEEVNEKEEIIEDQLDKLEDLRMKYHAKISENIRLSQQLDEALDEIDNLNACVIRMEGRIDDLQIELAEIEWDRDRIDTVLTNMEKKKFALVSNTISGVDIVTDI